METPWEGCRHSASVRPACELVRFEERDPRGLLWVRRAGSAGPVGSWLWGRYSHCTDEQTEARTGMRFAHLLAWPGAQGCGLKL